MSNNPLQNRNPIALYGAGGHAKVVFDVAIADPALNVLGFISDFDADFGKKLSGLRVSTLDEFIGSVPHLKINVAIGQNAVRSKIGQRLESMGVALQTIIHSAAIISPFVEIGSGVFIGAKGVVQSNAIIGSNSIVNTAAIIEHDCIVGRNSHISPGAILAGGVSVGEETWVGAGAIIKEKVKIGKRVIIGAGAVVLKDIPDNAIVAGVPARPIKSTSSQ